MKKLRKNFVPLLALGFVVSCAKERPLDEVYKGDMELFAKSSDKSAGKTVLPCQDPSNPCVYVPSVVETPRNVTASRPYWMGEQKLVTLAINENDITVSETEKDERYDDNHQNKSPVLKLDVKHVDFRCATNDFNECTNKEEENDEISWEQKKFVDVDYDSLQIIEKNFLPIQLDNLFGNCHRELGSRVIDKKIEKDAINIVVEKMYETSIECANVESLSNLTFTATYQYSMVELNSLASKGYQKVYYNNDDEDKFGFFTTSKTQLSVDNRQTENFQHDLLNRWNPEKEEVVYYLTDNFYKPEFKHILDYTIRGIESVNKSFEMAGAKTKIVLKKAEGRHSGDLRNNMLVLVEDPQATGVIGYGPSITNPNTGEIIHARTVMYYGTMVKFIKSSYDDLLEESGINPDTGERLVAKQLPKIKGVGSSASDIKLGLEKFTKEQYSKKKGGLFNRLFGRKDEMGKIFDKHDEVSVSKIALDHGHLHRHVDLGSASNLGMNRDAVFTKEKLKNILFDKKRTLKTKDLVKDMDYLEVLSRNNAYSGEMFNFDAAASASMKSGSIAKALGGELKPWRQMSNTEQNNVIAAIMEHVWIPTLVHEFGHNLGLRHNFNGSEDKDNYYTEEELAQVGIKEKITYSSIMDYAYSNWNELPMMGKYDVAALRFGYARMVELNNGQMARVPDVLVDAQSNTKIEVQSPMKTLLAQIDQVNQANQRRDASAAKIALKDFMFCTDEHVAVNPGCNRFDEGSGYAQMAQHYVDAYNKRYPKANFRRDRYSFSMGDDISRIGRTQYTLRGLRLFFEVYDRIKGIYGMSDEEYDQVAQSQNIEFLIDLKKAVNIAGNFMIDLIKTPDVQCVIVDAATGGNAQPVSLALLNRITGNDAIDCYSHGLIQTNIGNFVAAAHAGKSFQSKKDPNADYKLRAYADQIDVAGIWIEKLLAIRTLMDRELGSTIFDKYTGSFFDIPEFRQKITNLVVELSQDNINQKIVFQTPDGQELPFEGTFKFADTHKIPASIIGVVNRYFGLNEGNNDFSLRVMKELTSRIYSQEDVEMTSSLKNLFAVYKEIPNDGTNLKNLAKVETPVGTYFAKKDNALALQVFTMIEVRRILEKVDPEVLGQIIEDRSVDVTPANPEDVLNQDQAEGGNRRKKQSNIPDTPEVRAAQQVPTELIEAYLNDQIPSTEHMSNVLLGMPVL